MTLHTPLAMQPGAGDPDVTFTAQEWRMTMQALIGASGITLSQEGCLGSGQLQVTQRGAGANFSVDISAGQAFINGDDITNQGKYVVWNDATFNLATPGAPASGTRVHRVVAQLRDKLSNGSFTTYDWQFQLLQDTGSGTPAEPASAITLALVSIAAGQGSVSNANITDSRPQLAQALESYTPVIANQGSAAFSVTSGFYCRIGKMIYFEAYFAASAAGSGTTNVTVTAPTPIWRGPSANVRQQVPVFYDSASGGPRTGNIVAVASGSGAVWDRIVLTNRLANGSGPLRGTDIDADGIIVIQGWYREA